MTWSDQRLLRSGGPLLSPTVLGCVINISEGRDVSALQRLDAVVAVHLAAMPVSDGPAGLG